jgi:hypothetical protein
MLVHVGKPGLIARQDESPAELLCILEDLQKFITLPEMINLLGLRQIMQHESTPSINTAHTSGQDAKYC